MTLPRPSHFVLFLGIFTFLIPTNGCRQSAVPAPTPSLVTVATVEPAGAHLGRSSRFTGTVRPYRQVEVSFRVSGYVQNLLMLPGASGSRPVQSGDSVTAGTVLARIKSTDYQAHVDAVRATVSAARANVDEAQSKRSQAIDAISAANATVAEANADFGAARAQHDEAIAGVRVASATVADAEANVTIAKTTLDRIDGLYQSASATRPEFDAAKANYDSASAKLSEARGGLDAARQRVSESSAKLDAAIAGISAAKANVASSKSASVEAANAIAAANAEVSQALATEKAQDVSVADTSLRAPISGTIVARHVDIGSLVAPGTPAFSVAETSRMKVVFGIPESAASRLRVGQEVDLTVGAERGIAVRGAISDIASAADERTGMFDVEVTIPNSDGRVKVGMLSTLSTLPQPSPPGRESGSPETSPRPSPWKGEGVSSPSDEAVMAPVSAVVQAHDNPNGYAVVTVATEAGRATAHYHDVELGATHGDEVEVRGVRRGDVVVTSGPSLLYDGEVVDIAHSGPGAAE